MAGSLNADIIAKAVYQEDKKIAEDKRRETFRKAGVKTNRNKKSRWRSGICKLCGEYFHCITFAHAELHGFKHPNDMAKNADFIDWGYFNAD